jgi:hypothetical protein
MNYMLAVPGTNFTVTLLLNPDMDVQGITMGYGPGIGFARTETYTDLFSIVQAKQCRK